LPEITPADTGARAGLWAVVALWAYSYWAADTRACAELGSRACASWLGSVREFFELAKLGQLGSPAAREPARAYPSHNELELARRARAFFPALDAMKNRKAQTSSSKHICVCRAKLRKQRIEFSKQNINELAK
jgi:hypothetical protein